MNVASNCERPLSLSVRVDMETRMFKVREFENKSLRHLEPLPKGC